MRKFRQLSEEGNKALRGLVSHVIAAQLIRTFPNDRKITFRVSKWLNVIGKDLGTLRYELGFILGDVSYESYVEARKSEEQFGSSRIKLSPIPDFLSKEGELTDEEEVE